MLEPLTLTPTLSQTESEFVTPLPPGEGWGEGENTNRH